MNDMDYDEREVILSDELIISLNKLINYHKNILEQVFEITREQYCKQDIKTCEEVLLKLILYTFNHNVYVKLELNEKEIRLLCDIGYNFFQINYMTIKLDESIVQELRNLYKIISERLY